MRTRLLNRAGRVRGDASNSQIIGKSVSRRTEQDSESSEMESTAGNSEHNRVEGRLDTAEAHISPWEDLRVDTS